MLLSGSWENLPNRETEAQTTQGLAQGVWPPANLAGNITNPANIAGSWIHLGPSGQPSPPPEILGGLTAERGFSQRRPLPVPRLYSPSAQQKAKNQTASPSRKVRSAFSSRFLITFENKTHHRRKRVARLLTLPIPSLSPCTVQASEMLPEAATLQPEGRVNRKRLASCGYRSPLFSASPLPLIQEDPLGSPFKRA